MTTLIQDDDEPNNARLYPRHRPQPVQKRLEELGCGIGMFIAFVCAGVGAGYAALKFFGVPLP